ncbi:uncharacterized protein PFL1_04991 [Pseudozyma flocculosa PF-1]|uniref:RING-type domain-containing protein n=2 Tax=Pseudozyma flocculosa TaxID=84751 RepID=A0A5C3EV04_9BASI|nr:uncharacterized protein PFL1_04991 [Pseudozyma flocculosa PF-1]EPQ27453.1 hypothetical protein PFL1_04991 [Pseudozyma flocculosa PF-1]SPO36118.1 uncharacterized protein PSFLO_01589 [Pseudozyma flocculosa]
MSSPSTAAYRPPQAIDVASGDRNLAANDNDNDTVANARRVRRNLLRATWNGIGQLTRWRKFVLLSRLGVALVQVLAFTPVLFLGSSHGGSYTPGEYCNPQPMFIYLLLHVLRLVATIPCDLYLGLSPHRAAGAQRLSPIARERLERERPIGSILWDSRINKLSNIFTLLNIVLFVVGNLVVFQSTECSEPPADSVALFFTCLTALIISYLILLEITILLVLLVCALPLLIVILRALGLGDRAQQLGIKPATAKVDQEEVDKRVKLVYFAPAKEEREGADATDAGGSKRTSLDQVERAFAGNAQIGSGEDSPGGSRLSALMAASIPLPPSRPGSPVEEVASPSTDAAGPALARTTTRASSVAAKHRLPGGLGRLQRLFWSRRAATRPIAGGGGGDATPRKEAPAPAKRVEDIPKHRRRKLAHPLLEIPAHRATCAICLSDFEEPSLDLADPEPEPLRHLDCGHVLHKSCVDEWFTTVSARCPICQKSIVTSAPSGEPVEPARGDQDADRDVEAQQGRDGAVDNSVPQIPMTVLRPRSVT